MSIFLGEPELEDLLGDPIAVLLMDRDGCGVDELRALAGRMKRALGGHDTSVAYEASCS